MPLTISRSCDGDIASASLLAIKLPHLFLDQQRPCEQSCMACVRCLGAVNSFNSLLVESECWSLKSATQLVGIVYFTNISPGLEAQFHAVMFDHKLFGRAKVLNQVLDYYCDWRIVAAVPDYVRHLSRYLQRYLEFSLQKHVDSSVPYRGQLHGVDILVRR